MSAALTSWATERASACPHLRAVGYFGSYARGDWGLGSDLDVVIIDAAAGPDRLRRGLAWDLNGLPVPADVLVYTPEEWQRLTTDARGFCQRLRVEVRWVFGAPG